MTNFIDKAERVLDILEADLASDFVLRVETLLRRLPDPEINALFLLTTTENFGDRVHVWTAALAPVIEREFDLRRDIATIPRIGPVIAPDLYRKGGGHYVPF